ncbi:hypothetical protein SG34_017805 [Thalassomonas viridans]|uniref:Swiss Army Knife 2H phosphoesterase domain-containing protein n=1 Tax=Thalassomonas viridans TaxID=137584 RepID=A0AAE9YZ50_9GAMM|nr:hypothetical protein [Thalassomonas viridans]WDE03247.1 hypothetical protein SG34_017805 [Thalassomonas viridans]
MVRYQNTFFMFVLMSIFSLTSLRIQASAEQDAGTELVKPSKTGETVLERIKKQEAAGLALAEGSSEVQKTIRITPEKLTDSGGLVYLGGKISEAVLAPYLAQLKQELGADYALFRENQGKRDHFSFHMTLINPYEYQNLNIGPEQLKQPLTVQLLGLGRVSAGKKSSYYVVARSQDGQFFRQKHLLPAKDFHVTLGFNPQDVHGVSKGMETLLTDKELKREPQALTR